MNPSGQRSRIEANLAALRVLRELQASHALATTEQQQALARWGSWGAVPAVFDEATTTHEAARAELKSLLSESEYLAARRTTINAHYTNPAYVRSIWQLVSRLGFTGGRVLEPGCGSGTFIGLAPEGTEATGVELDPVSAAIAQQLYQRASIRAESFADSKLGINSFDAVIGNVPFGDVKLHDPRFNRGRRHSIHNHFIIKSLQLTRPGGLVAVLTSRYTLDSTNPAARREMNFFGELIGAVRLPSGAHTQTAGTEAVTDLLVFRRRDPDAPVPDHDPDWIMTREVPIDGQTQRINTHFLKHPDMVLGTFASRIGLYGVMGLHIDGHKDPADITAALEVACEQIVRHAEQNNLLMQAPSPDLVQARQVAHAPAPSELYHGHITAQPDGTFTTVSDGFHVPFQVPAAHAAELRALLVLRDHAHTLVEREAASLDDGPDVEELRTTLRTAWESYTATYGAINRISTRTLPTKAGADPEEADERVRRTRPPAVRKLSTDPFGALVTALELYDEVSGNLRPAGLLLERQVLPRQIISGADTPSDALATSLNERGRVDVDYIAQLLGLETEQAVTELGELVWELPRLDVAANPVYVTAAEYLSGDVRSKLRHAREAQVLSPGRWDRHVEALTEVRPPELGSSDITARLGSVWIPASDVQSFLRHILNDDKVKVAHVVGSEWSVTGVKDTVLSTSRWGTGRMPAGKLLAALLTQAPLVVKDKIDSGDRVVEVVNPVETEAAQDKAREMQDAFEDWLWSNADRTARLLEDYNDRFNCLVARDYSRESSHLTFPGLVSTFTPREHQRAAVARMIAEPSVGLFHEVGAGKTAEMVIGASELKRLQMIRKPAVVVPNHMLEQFTREWLQLYPTAKILSAASADIGDGATRRQFIASAAANDWDAVIFTRGAFNRLRLSESEIDAYVAQESSAWRAALDAAQVNDPGRVKQLEKKLSKREETLKAKLDTPRDPGLGFEATGIDYLIVDELHDYKNLWTPSTITGAEISGSVRATDLHMKLCYLRSTYGNKVMTGATATPIANSMTEMFVMQRYLAPEQLTAAGIDSFDQWAATFGETVVDYELDPTGTRYRLKGRFAKFNNVPELVSMFNRFGDVKTSEDLQLPTPEIARRSDGTRAVEILTVPASPELAAYLETLQERAELIQKGFVEPSEDNMLKITNDGRHAALDLRLVGEEPPTLSKVDVAADKLAEVYQATKDRRYTDETGEPHPQPGALQIVFCDLSTPQKAKGGAEAAWNVYDALREALVARGVPRERIRFVHEASSDEDKARLFAQCRDGQVSVIIGSTSKMGTGTNIQRRAVHLLHMDAPWRPADVTQREGRAVRQGNQNSEVMLTQVVAQKSFDTYMWQTLERKQKFISQVMTNRIGARDIEDIDVGSLSYAEMKAISNDDPLMLDELQARTDLTKYRRLEKAHQRNHDNLKQIITREYRVKPLADLAAQYAAAAAKAQPTAGDAFRMVVGGRHVTERKDAAQLLQQLLDPRQHWSLQPGQRTYRTTDLAEVGGFKLLMNTNPYDVEISVEGYNRCKARLPKVDLAKLSALGLVTRLENLITPGLAKEAAQLAADRDSLISRIAVAKADLDKPFKHHEALAAAEARYKDITAAITARASQDALPKQATDVDLGPEADGMDLDEEEVATALLGQLMAMNLTRPTPTETSSEDPNWVEVPHGQEGIEL